MLVVSNAFIVLTNWAIQRFAWGRNHSISRKLLSSYLYRPYEYFLNRNSAELSKNILEEVKAVASSMLKPVLRGTAKGIVALFIVGFLFFVDPVVAGLVTVTLGGAYTGIYLYVQDWIDRMGEARVEANTARYQVVSEAFGGIKVVKLRGKEDAFLQLYDSPSQRFARVQADYKVIKKVPRYVLEAVAFGGIILIATYRIAIQDDVRQVIPILGLYAFAGYRLMPALQQAFGALASVRFNTAALRELSGDMKEQVRTSQRSKSDRTASNEVGSVTLEEKLVLDGVYFTYPDAKKATIKNLSFEIPSKSTVGFVGETGSGKTTTVDIILGLLRPTRGKVEVDGTRISEDNVFHWQRGIGYVPQKIYLSDDTIARNIAFGVPEEKIDMRAVQDAAHRAHIFEFVDTELPEGWNTTVGERGVKLSGGQRQRIGIARALYHDPSVLVFDEATSALDQATEASVMEAIYDLEGDHTMFMIAHRLSTVRRSDKIIMLENGRKIGEGTYEELEQRHSKFRSMALS